MTLTIGLTPQQYDITAEWAPRGPGARDAYLSDLQAQGFIIGDGVDLDSAVPPMVYAPQQPNYGVPGTPTGTPGIPAFLPTMGPAGQDSYGPVSFLPNIPADQTGGAYAPGILSQLTGWGGSLGIGGTGIAGYSWWQLATLAGIGLAAYTALRHLPPSRQFGAAVSGGLAAGLLIGIGQQPPQIAQRLGL